jgi:peptidoglycan DL-endopeptidase CwlO
MKQRSTTPVSASFVAKAATVACAILMAIATPIQIGQTAFADSYEEQIKAIQGEIGQYENKAAKLNKKANTYQGALDKLTAEKQTIQNQIELSQAKYDKFVTDIKKNEKKIAENKDALGDTIASMYVEADISPLEMVASSSNISEFIDKQTQRSTVQNKLNDTVDEIEKLKKELEKQKVAVGREIVNQKNARQLLAQKEAEKARLVAETRGQESEYKKLVSEKNAQVSNLRAEQAEANRRALEAAAAQNGGGWSGGIPSGTPGGGGYPGVWANAPLDAFVDPWGLYTRECVSYTAWKVANSGRFVPHFGGRGNANQWPSTTAAYDIPNGYTPRAGAVAIMMIGEYGHAMYVESVNSDGSITVSDYNFAWDGLYRQYNRSASGLTYIYF